MLNPNSHLNFEALAVPMFFRTKSNGKDSFTLPVSGHKAIIRRVHPYEASTQDSKFISLGVVSNTWRIAQNAAVFEAAEEAISRSIGDYRRDDVAIKDSWSHNGARCYREYIFPPTHNIGVSKLGFRIICKNGFDGSTPVGMYFGAIDGFCTNGMIFGQYEEAIKRHTSGFDPSIFIKPVQNAVEKYFKETVAQVQKWQTLVPAFSELELFFNDLGMSERMSAQMQQRVIAEEQQRDWSLWTVVSAMTYFSSHDSEEFAVKRRADNDNVATVLLERQQQVRKWLQSDAFKKLEESCRVAA